MNIIFLRSNPVDPDSRVEKEVNSLLKGGHKVTIFAWDRAENYKVKKEVKEFENGKVLIYRVGIMAKFGGGFKVNLKPLLNFQLEILKFLNSERRNYDIIHACDFDTAYIASKYAKIFKKKLIYDIFDYYIDSFNVPKMLKDIIKKMDYNVINKSDAVIICSEQRKLQIKGTKPNKLEIIHNTPDINLKSENLFILNKAKVKIVYVGILIQGRFISEMANIIKDKKDIELHIGGFGELENELKTLSLEYDNIFFYGKLSYEKTLQLENSCDIITAIYDPKIKNHFYAAPNKFYEALMLGKPLIMVRNTGMSEIIIEEGIGELMEWSEDGFKLALDNLLNKKREWNNISEKMKKIYDDKYSWSKMENRIINLYENINN